MVTLAHLANWVENTPFFRAAGYSDLMWKTRFLDGEVDTSLAAYYICRHQSQDPLKACLTLIEAKSWDRSNSDPLGKYQRWYCRCCGGRHEKWMGMILEIRQRDQVVYARTPVRDIDTQHLHTLVMEANATVQDSLAPRDVYNGLERLSSLVGGFIRRAVTADFHDLSRHCPYARHHGVYKVDNEWFATLPEWDWTDLFVPGSALRNLVLSEGAVVV